MPLRGHFDKAESSRFPTEFVFDNLDRIDFAERFKNLFDVFFLGFPRKMTDEEVHASSSGKLIEKDELTSCRQDVDMQIRLEDNPYGFTINIRNFSLDGGNTRIRQRNRGFPRPEDSVQWDRGDGVGRILADGVAGRMY